MEYSLFLVGGEEEEEEEGELSIDHDYAKQHTE